MSNQFLKLRRSAVQGKIPETSSLDLGELAINTYDGQLFLKKSGSEGEIVTVVGSTGSFTGSFTGNGAGLTNIPASGITGLNLSRIATGSITASVDVNQTSFSIASSSVNLLTSYNNGALNHGDSSTASGIFSHAEGIGTVASGSYSHAEGNGTIAKGYTSHAEGENSEAIGDSSHAEGENTQAIGYNSHTEGRNTIASGEYSHAEGNNTIAIGNNSHAEGASNKTGVTTAVYATSISSGVIIMSSSIGNASPSFPPNSRIMLFDTPFDDEIGRGIFIVSQSYYSVPNTIIELYDTNVNTTTAFVYRVDGNAVIGNQIIPGENSHAEGANTISLGDSSHAEGNNTQAIGNTSHAEGRDTRAIGNSSHAEGDTTQAIGGFSHAEGYYTQAIGNSSHAEGDATIASGEASHAEGVNTIASGSYSHAEGGETIAVGTYSHAEGVGSIAGNGPITPLLDFIDSPGHGAHAEGFLTLASGSYSHTEGESTVAIGRASHAEGYYTYASGLYSHAEGSYTSASEFYSHAEGGYTLASGFYSHAEGNSTIAIGNSSHAEGAGAISFEEYSHAEGYNSVSSGSYSHAEGYNTIARGISSHAEGRSTLASGQFSHAEGRETIASGNYQHVQGQYNISSSAQSAFIIGNGVDDANRSNLVFASGSTFQVSGSLLVTGSSIALRGGSFSGSGANLYDIPASGISGLNLSRIATGSISASVNTDISGSFRLTSGSNTLLNVTRDGFVWIGNGSFTNVGYQLDIQGATRIKAASSGNQLVITDFATNNSLFTFTGNGRLFIGTSSFPSYIGSNNNGDLFIYNQSDGNATISYLKIGTVGVMTGGLNNQKQVEIQSSYNTGTLVGTHTDLWFTGTINGLSTNIYRAVYVNKTITSADFRAFESSTGGGYFNTTNVNASAILQADSTTKGFLPTRTNSTASITSPAQGLLTYITASGDVEGLWQYRTGSGWVQFLHNSSSIPASSVVGLNLSRISTGSITASVSTDISASFRLTSGSNTLLNVTREGFVWIGNGSFTNQAYQLDVQGTARVSNTLTALRINTDGLANLNGFSAAFKVIEIQGTTAYGGTAYIYDGGLWRWREGTKTGYFRIGNGGNVSINGIPWNSTGDFNVAVGTGAGGNGSGSAMTAVGHGALAALTTGNANTSIGQASLYDVTSGSNNTAIGTYAGISTGGNPNANHNDSIFIGVGNGWLSSGTPLTNTYIIGNSVRTNLSNVFMLGRSDQVIMVGQGASTGSSAIFQIDSTTKGFLAPRMTAAQRTAISSPAQGLIVYDTGSITEGLWFYNSGSNPGWQEVLTNSGSQLISGSINLQGSFILNGTQFNNTSSITSTGITTISQLSTSSYTSCFYNYTVASASNARSGQVMTVWNGNTIRYTEVVTTDIGDTSLVSVSASLSSGFVRLQVSASSGWTFKNISNLL